MKKTINNYTTLFSILALLSVGASSCGKGYLDEKPYSNYDATNVDPTTVENRLLG